MDWKFHCEFGGKEGRLEGEMMPIISTIAYDYGGQFLAIGDTKGRITILERKQENNNGQKKIEYRHHLRFQSHEPEFDYLKSAEIEERINQIKWLPRLNPAHMFLAANDKTIKLWKLHNQQTRGAIFPEESPLRSEKDSSTEVRKSLRRTFKNAHAYHINSVSLSSDKEIFLSADDLRVNIWNMEKKDSWNVVDIKPQNMEDLNEVITSASFHPLECCLFSYSTSKGALKLVDLRQGTYLHMHSKILEYKEQPENKTFFSEVISSVSDAQFSQDGRYIVSRDYMTVKIWDLKMIGSQPLKILSVHEPSRERLLELYENDCIFDKFECGWSNNMRYVVTGSYKNTFKICDVAGIASLTTGQTAPRTSPIQFLTFEATNANNNMNNRNKNPIRFKFGKKNNIRPDDAYERSDYNQKVLHLAMHPSSKELAVSLHNRMLIFATS